MKARYVHTYINYIGTSITTKQKTLFMSCGTYRCRLTNINASILKDFRTILIMWENCAFLFYEKCS